MEMPQVLRAITSPGELHFWEKLFVYTFLFFFIIPIIMIICLVVFYGWLRLLIDDYRPKTQSH